MPFILRMLVLTCRCPAGAFSAASLAEQAAAGGCLPCGSRYIDEGAKLLPWFNETNHDTKDH
jgi:hypothetical protein